MALNTLNLSKSRINGLASAEIKKDEKGILNLAKKLDISVNFVELDKLRLFSSKMFKNQNLCIQNLEFMVFVNLQLLLQQVSIQN